MPTSPATEAALAALSADPSKTLGLTIGTQKVTPGLQILRHEAQGSPTLSLPGANPTKTYIAISIDLDAPFPSFPIMGPILHWVQPGLKSTNAETGELTSSEPHLAGYIPPGPPPLSDWHRYVFLLYEQPKDFEEKLGKGGLGLSKGEEMPRTQRMRCDVEGFLEKLGVGEVVGVNYFLSKR